MNILVIGSGGREHAFGWRIRQSALTDKLFFAPGNAGTDVLGTNLAINPNDFLAVKEAVLKNRIKLVWWDQKSRWYGELLIFSIMMKRCRV
jgi:phosphoribosylamine---glycine ligase